MVSTHDQEVIRLISDICVSVIRDRSISSAYGKYISIFNRSPELTCFFSQTITDKLQRDFDRYGIDINRLCLYSGLGDFYSQLSRLLMLCRETNELKQYVEEANSKLSIIIGAQGSDESAYIRHLRNAVAHGRVDFDTRRGLIHFIDMRRDGSKSAEYILDSQQINEIIEILLSDVLLKYLLDIGWSLS